MTIDTNATAPCPPLVELAPVPTQQGPKVRLVKRFDFLRDYLPWDFVMDGVRCAMSIYCSPQICDEKMTPCANKAAKWNYKPPEIYTGNY